MPLRLAKQRLLRQLRLKGAAPERIRLRTLILLRWLAVLGQVAAVLAARALGVQFHTLPVMAVIGAGVAANLWLWLGPPVKAPDRAVEVQLVCDLAQISVLIALTGGMSNPFALLVLAPVIVAATALDGRRTVAIGVATMGLMTMAGVFALPIYDRSGAVLALPPLLALGHWAALMIGVGFFGFYAHRVAVEYEATSEALFAMELALSREQRLQHLGGVVAAAAHEMGTPLATIKLVSSELAAEIGSLLPDRDDLAEDMQLLSQSADRCRDILRSMGRAGKDDLLLKSAPVRAVLDEAAEPHQGRRGITVHITAPDETSPDGTEILREPGLIHGLRNLIQNAVDFAATSVWVRAEWHQDRLDLMICDDGPGYPPALLHRMGEPFLTTRGAGREGDGLGQQSAGAYEGMGLGLFIAKALLERSGARLHFANGRGPGLKEVCGCVDVGACVSVTWPRAVIENLDHRRALGPNHRIDR